MPEHPLCEKLGVRRVVRREVTVELPANPSPPRTATGILNALNTLLTLLRSLSDYAGARDALLVYLSDIPSTLQAMSKWSDKEQLYEFLSQLAAGLNDDHKHASAPHKPNLWAALNAADHAKGQFGAVLNQPFQHESAVEQVVITIAGHGGQVAKLRRALLAELSKVAIGPFKQAGELSGFVVEAGDSGAIVAHHEESGTKVVLDHREIMELG